MDQSCKASTIEWGRKFVELKSKSYYFYGDRQKAKAMSIVDLFHQIYYFIVAMLVEMLRFKVSFER